jgi:hypothetical protein
MAGRARGLTRTKKVYCEEDSVIGVGPSGPVGQYVFPPAPLSAIIGSVVTGRGNLSNFQPEAGVQVE